MTRPARLLTLCALALVALGGTACGNRIDIRTLGETEGLYLDLSGLKYQVQMSRYLNPRDVEDRAYLQGVSDPELSSDETWFGVFLRVQNDTTDETSQAAEDFTIHDTQDNEYDPVEIDPAANAFVYQPRALTPGGLIPAPESAPFNGPIQGSLILFKITYATTQNRPLEFRITSPEDPKVVGIVDLDV